MPSSSPFNCDNIRTPAINRPSSISAVWNGRVGTEIWNNDLTGKLHDQEQAQRICIKRAKLRTINPRVIYRSPEIGAIAKNLP